MGLGVLGVVFFPVWFLITATLVQLLPWLQGGEVVMGDSTVTYELPVWMQLLVGGGLSLVLVGSAGLVALGGSLLVGWVSERSRRGPGHAVAVMERLPADVQWRVTVERAGAEPEVVDDAEFHEHVPSPLLGPDTGEGYTAEHVSTDPDRQPG